MADAFGASPAAAADAATAAALADSPRPLPPAKYSPPYLLQVCVCGGGACVCEGWGRVCVKGGPCV